MELEHDLQLDSISEEPFSFSGFQVVRGEFFAHINEPSVTFSRYRIAVNTACLKKLPAVRFIQILIHPEKKKLVIRPCSEDERDSFQWYTEHGGKRKPRQLTCRIFFAKVMDLMKWNPDYRYKLLGNMIRCNDECLILFDLHSAEMYRREIGQESTASTVRHPIFPEAWKHQFGLPAESHQQMTQLRVLEGYTVFGVREKSHGKEEQLCLNPEQSQLL